MILIIINIWLIIIFWKIIVLESSVNISNNNQLVLKLQTLMQPLLQILGLDVLNLNTLKMITITVVIIISNLAVLYFSQMMAFMLLGICARYSYKAYNNYIDKDTLNYYGFEKIKEITLEERNEIFKEFLIEKAVKDENLINFLQYKLNNTSNLNKNELILTLNNNLLEYKQQLIGKLLLEQKQQISLVTKKPTLLESLDINTLIKVGVSVIIIGGLVWLGYSYYNNNNAIQAANEIGKENLNVNNALNARIDHTTQLLTDTMTKNFEVNNKALLETTVELRQIVNQQKNISVDILEIGNVNEKNIELTQSNSQMIHDIAETLKKVNQNVIILTDNVSNVSNKTLELDIKVNGGTIPVNEIDGEIITSGEATYNPLLEEVKEISSTVSLTCDTLNALLTFLGLDNLELNNRAYEMLQQIRSANAVLVAENIETENENNEKSPPL